ncbi:FAD:protein FMN transferase [Cellulophaga sp. F20128]|uniref:FAD:protein FMN transferase n=1 Tax=Cellulophaga sp. F20128 TaxID=2926413 RepID=UPI001FF67190|nr:FAD:protein FMN transferase [Cellulophaga sp. F20128]MCK0158531.1 FAD:protein FMN transferase [Cellulophaga sp. F20128]
MGNRFDFTIVAQQEATANLYIDLAIAEVQRIEKLISSWDSSSETSQVNNNAGIQAVPISKELYGLIERSIQLSKVTDGAFDISYAAMDVIWKFNIAMDYVPTDEAILRSVENVGYKNIVLNKEAQTVFLPQKGMKIAFGGIGKGYAADKVKALLQEKGVVGGIINAAGDLTTWGTQVSGKKWMVGITNPLDKEKIFSWLPIVESSVATSGNYEKYILFKGDKYSHIIDPRTGWPSKGVKSVSVFAKKAEMCDALATSVFVMGVETGLSVINQLAGVEVIIVDESNKIHKSAGIVLQNY